MLAFRNPEKAAEGRAKNAERMRKARSTRGKSDTRATGLTAAQRELLELLKIATEDEVREILAYAKLRIMAYEE
jgi:hypothetical protein